MDGNGNPSKYPRLKFRSSNEEFEDKVKYLVGEDYYSKLNEEAADVTGEFLYQKLYEQVSKENSKKFSK